MARSEMQIRGRPFHLMFREPRHGLALLADTPAILRRAVRLYGISIADAIRRMQELYRRGFAPQAALRLGLFDPALRTPDLDRYLSNYVIYRLQRRINPPGCSILTRNKGMFYRHCALQGLPVPKLYALYWKSTAGCTADGRILASAGDWCHYLSTLPADEFVVKPMQGAYGTGLLLLRRTASGFVDQDGRVYAAQDLLNELQESPQLDSCVIQERLLNHPDITKMSNATGLQTIRVITLIDRTGTRKILHASMKLIVGQLVVDNFHGGLYGNLTANINLSDGTLTKGMILPRNHDVFTHIAEHPETHFHFEGVRVPGWEEVCSLALKAADAFLPLRTVGWDIAFTQTGAKLVEGNSSYDAPPAAQGYDVNRIEHALRNDVSTE